jgi:hypothetical protein
MTEMNRESSRSHAVFTVSVESRRRPYPGAALQKRSALLHLVDLAGSERQKSTESAGVRLKVGLSKLHPVATGSLKGARFQPLNLSSEERAEERGRVREKRDRERNWF